MNRNSIDHATQTKFMYLFERISEPIYFGPRGHGENRVLYLTPLDRLPPNVARAAAELRKGLPLDQLKTIEVSYSSVPYDLSHVKIVPKDAIFSYFCKLHRDAAGALIKIFSEQKSLNDFFNAACMCRDEVNSHLWLYSLGRAMILRPDMKGFKLPGVWEVMPDRFFNGNILREARRQARLPQNERAVIVLDKSFSGTDLNPENKLVYFREDAALNSAHWMWHIVYPMDAPSGQRDRKGELFYKMHHDMLARYEAERLGNGLARCETLDIQTFVEEGYFSKLTLENSAQQWGTRQANTPFKNINRLNDPNNRLKVDLRDMQLWTDRIYEAIDQSLVITPAGQTISLVNEKGIDILGAMVESSTESPNQPFYGDLHNQGHGFNACCADPDYRFKENPGVMISTATAVRDSVFFRWHKFIDDTFLRHKAKLPTYEAENLLWSGLTVTSFSLQTEDRTPNTLVTFFEERDVDLSRGLDFGRASFNNLGPIMARFTHLQHESFLYRVEVANSTGRPQVGTVRIFMAPRLDEHQTQLSLTQQQRLFFEMDKFTVSLKSGTNFFDRRSQDSSVTIPWDQSFQELERNVQTLNAQQVICGCGWPQHLLIPKGKPEGQEFDVFVIITNWEQDRVRRKNPVTDAESPNCKQSVSFCGILDELFPDTKSMGYPFDRLPRLDPNGQTFGFLEDWIIPNSNMKAIQVDVIHRNITTLAGGSLVNVPIMVQGQLPSDSKPKYDAGKKSTDLNSPRGVVGGGGGGGGGIQGYRPSPSNVRGLHGDWVDLGNLTDYSRRPPRESVTVQAVF